MRIALSLLAIQAGHLTTFPEARHGPGTRGSRPAKARQIHAASTPSP